MSQEPPRPSDWTRASPGIYGVSLEELALVIGLVRESYDLTGRWITPAELQARLRRPGL
jgi:hypothetical protein